MRNKYNISEVITRKFREMFGYLAYLTYISTEHIISSVLSKSTQDNCSRLRLNRDLYGNLSSDALHIIIEEINEEYQLPTKLFLAGKGAKEISRETGIPIRKVLQQIYYGEKEIKAHLKQL